MVLVGTLQSSRDERKPSRSRDEKRIIGLSSISLIVGRDLPVSEPSVYHLVDKKIECQVPVIENVRDVTITSDRDMNNGYLALISYEDTAPPELWRISVVNQETRLHLLQTYMPTAVVEFAGPSYLG